VAVISGVLRRNQDLLRNAGSMAATTGVTSLFGFAFWVYAARFFSSEAVGYGSAAISTMILLGFLGMFGLDTTLMGELPRSGNRGGLTMASCIAAFFISFALGVGFSLVSLAFGSHFIQINGTVARIFIFSLGVALTGATSVFDSASIGVLRGGLQLSRNVAISVAKMVVLPAVAVVLHDMFGVGIILAWVIGTIISLVPVIVMIKRGGSRVLHRPDWASLWRLRKLAQAHNWLNLAISAPVKLVPVLVAVVVPPSSNGAFYIANMIFSFLLMVPQSLSTVLYAVASAAPEKIAEKLRFVLRMSLVIGIPSGLAIGLLSHVILSIFSAKYAVLAAGPLWILIASYIPGLPNVTYIAVARVQGRFKEASILLAVFAILRMAAVVVGGKADGLYGLSFGMLGVSVVQAMIMTPSVLRTAFNGTPTVGAADVVTTSERTSERVPRQAGLEGATYREQQLAGIDVLVEIATRVTPNPVSAETGPLSLGILARHRQ
jgi:O-antigen/teichoic acid export membrane protein